MALYNTIGVNYDATRKADPYITQRLLHLLQPRPEGRYLDIACGTGNYTVALRSAGLNMEGMDPSSIMLERAREKDRRFPWLQGYAEDIPAADGVYDGVMCTLAIHHFQDLDAAFAQVARVMRGGRFVIFTCTHAQIRGYWLNHYFPKCIERMYDYMPDLPRVEQALNRAGLRIVETEPYFVDDQLQDCFLYCHKNRPERYLNMEFLQGMSVFSAKAKPQELQEGIARLRADIESGEIYRVLQRYSSCPQGDYLFVVAEQASE